MLRGNPGNKNDASSSLLVKGNGLNTSLGIFSKLGGTEYSFEMRMDSDNAGGGVYDIEINRDTTAANYWIDSTAAAAVNTNVIGGVTSATGFVILKGNMYIDNNGTLIMFYDSYEDSAGTGTPLTNSLMLYMTASQKTINSIELKEISTGGNFKSSAYIKLTEVTK
jgi:hypothetical protein